MKAGYGLIIVCAGLLSGGCATYRIVSIPDTPEALTAYRQCMAMEHLQLLPSCMAGVSNVRISKERSAEYQLSTGCRLVTKFRDGFHYVQVQACDEQAIRMEVPDESLDSTLQSVPAPEKSKGY